MNINNLKNRFLKLLLILFSTLLQKQSFAVAPINSINSSFSIEDQIIKLERIYNTHSQFLIQIQQQISDNQNEIDILRGQIQEIQHHLNRIMKCQEQMLIQINTLSNNK